MSKKNKRLLVLLFILYSLFIEAWMINKKNLYRDGMVIRWKVGNLFIGFYFVLCLVSDQSVNF